MNHPAYDPLLTVKPSAEYLGMSTEALLQKARKREIACVRDSSKKGSPVKFRLSALNDWIRKHEVRPLRQASA